MKKALVHILLGLLLTPLAFAAQVLVAEVRGPIGPASAAYFQRALAEAKATDADLLVLRLDTPGGLDSSMRDMIRALLASPVPVAVYVAPSGARAASAGTYLMYASHIAAMAPGTNLGAATPVSIGLGGGHGDAKPQQDDGKQKDGGAAGGAMERKATQDAAAYLRSLAQMRGRNADWAERAVTKAESLSAEEAFKSKVIDLIATDVDNLLAKAQGRTVRVGDEDRVLDLAGAATRVLERNWQERLLSLVSDPNIALLLLMIGVYGLILEFYHPGTAVPGVIGGISLLLGAYGLALLPINIVGAALLLLGLALMVAEAFVPSFGVLGIGGLAAFVAGALMLVDSEIPGLAVSMALVLPLALTSLLILAGAGSLALRARRRPSVAGVEGMLGGEAEALEDIDREGTVRAFGELWHARSSAPLPRHARARVRAVEGLTLVIDPKSETEGEGR